MLEAAAAGLPMISTRVGGIPELFGAESRHLIAPDDMPGLVRAIAGALDAPEPMRGLAQTLRNRVRREFSVAATVDGGLEAYRQALALRKIAQFA